MYSDKPFRKPFIARGSNLQRCVGCRLAVSLCICSELRSGPAVADFWLLMHHNEFYKPSNTGQLILHSIEGSGCSEWARLTMAPEFERLMQSRAHEACLVFPAADDYRERMITDTRQLGERPLFIIPDGTWRQARRIFRHSTYLQSLPVIEPEVAFSSQYRLRKSDPEHHLCTAEIAAALLMQLGDKLAGERLLANFALFNARYAASRGRNLEGIEAVSAAVGSTEG